jgi:hypothetical protein
MLSHFSVPVQKETIFRFVRFLATEKVKTTNFSPSSFVVDFGSGIRDPGSGINIPDPQHWLSVLCGQCCGFRSVRIRIYFCRLDPYLDPHWKYGSRSRRAKMIHKSEENSSFEVLDDLF